MAGRGPYASAWAPFRWIASGVGQGQPHHETRSGVGAGRA